MLDLKFLLFISFSVVIISCNHSWDSKYIDIEKPGIQVKLFAPQLLNADSVALYGSVFNREGSEFFYGVDLKTRSEIRGTKFIDGQWSEPTAIISDSTYGYNDPFLSPDEQRLFYISNQPINKQDTIGDFDIWFSEKQGDEWSPPINAGAVINTEKNEYYVSFAKNGDMYFSSNKNAEVNRSRNFDIYKSEFRNNKFEEPVVLSDSINTSRYEADVFIDPNEEYIIFCSARRSGLGNGDLYISFKNENEEWTKAKNMGPSINSKGHELCPFVTHDGKYLFYTSEQKIYWVSTDILDTYKVSSN